MQKIGTKDTLDIVGEGELISRQKVHYWYSRLFQIILTYLHKNKKIFETFLDAVGTKNNNDLQKRSLPTNPRFWFKFAVLL